MLILSRGGYLSDLHLDLHEGDGLSPEPAPPVLLLLHRPLVHVRAALQVPAAQSLEKRILIFR